LANPNTSAAAARRRKRARAAKRKLLRDPRYIRSLGIRILSENFWVIVND
jgi:hypothetical protein